MVVTSVTGHLTESTLHFFLLRFLLLPKLLNLVDFPAPFNKNWKAVDPMALFDMEIIKEVREVLCSSNFDIQIPSNFLCRYVEQLGHQKNVRKGNARL